MMKKLTLYLLLIFQVMNVFSQEKTALDHSGYASWMNIGTSLITDDGKFLVYQVNPLKGDGFLVVSNLVRKTNDTIFRGSDPVILPGDAWLVARIKPGEDLLTQLKREKKKDDELPADSMIIYSLGDRSKTLYSDVESFTVAKEGNAWLVAKKKFRPKKEEKDEIAAEEENNQEEGTTEVQEENELDKKFEKLVKQNKATDLLLINPELSVSEVYENVLKYSLSRNGQLTGFVQLKHDSLPGYVAYAWFAPEQKLFITGEGEGIPAQLGTDDGGLHFAWAVSGDSARVAGLDLYSWTPGLDNGELLIGEEENGLLPGWGLSKNAGLFFSEDGTKLYFGAAPILPELPEDTLLKEEKYAVDIWNWKDPVLQPEQLKQRERDRKQTWLSVIIPGDHKAVQLADSSVDRVELLHRNNGRYLLGIEYDPYARLMNWDGYRYCDAWIVDNITGEKKRVGEKLPLDPSLSAFGKYLIWYQTFDSAWFAYDIAESVTRNLTGKIPVPFYDEDNDVPAEPGPYGLAGWSNNDKYLLIYDRYDIWKIDPSGKEKAVCLTEGKGRASRVRYRYERTNRDDWFIDLDGKVYLNSFNTEDMTSGFAVWSTEGKTTLQELVHGPWRYSSLEKAKDADKFSWRKQDFNHYPDLWVSGNKFTKAEKISALNPQQADYLWGSVQLVNWVSYAGDSLKGLLYTPENLDPAKKYPMLVYYYERNSEDLYRYILPAPSRSIINPTWCVSNDYIVFIPDIVYRTGYPGQSAYDAVLSGTEAMLDQFPFIDKDHMGLQGQSWGGYQTAYLVTRTDMFAAAMAGAPVSNMTSAYGGIRWGSGLSRMFQYEHSQSRIGGTLWEKPELYIENSPVFFAPDVHTPLLMMHNDNDGAVPWYQGIEYFVALRRLGKPVWMLVYNGEEHNLTKWPNRVDLDIRMMQFFDHYLKGAPEPEWMSVGIPAVRKGEIDAYGTGVE